MDKRCTDETKVLFDALLELKTAEECRMLLEDLCTVKEIRDMGQRLKVAALLRDGTCYNRINETTGVSTATISRVSRCLDYGSGGYRLILDRLAQKGQERDQ